jgi:hypothetical protein
MDIPARTATATAVVRKASSTASKSKNAVIIPTRNAMQTVKAARNTRLTGALWGK